MNTLMNEYIGRRFRKTNTDTWVIVGGSCNDYMTGNEYVQFKHIKKDSTDPFGPVMIMPVVQFFNTFEEERILA